MLNMATAGIVAMLIGFGVPDGKSEAYHHIDTSGMDMNKARARASAAPARDGDIAVREEYDMAVSQGTLAALGLFVRRHPDHPLADKARWKLEQLRRCKDSK